jgi:hypothetical protein
MQGELLCSFCSHYARRMTDSATFTTPEASDEDLGELLLGIFPPDGMTMDTNRRKNNHPGRIVLTALLLILSNPAYATDFMQCEAIAKRRKELTRFYLEMQIDAQESIKKRILDAKCGKAVKSTTMEDLQVILECKKSYPTVNYGNIEEYKRYEKSFLAPIRKKLNQIERESKKKQCI